MSFVHIHLMINHSPLYSTAFAFCFLLAGMIIKNRSIATAGLLVAVVAALCAFAADFTGNEAADIIGHAPPIAGVDTKLINEHDQAATFVLISSSVAAVVAIVALYLGRKKPVRPRWIEVVILVLLAWSFSVVARTALLGGRIHHPEVRAVVSG